MPTFLPRGESCWYAVGFRDQARSSGVPGKSRVVATRPAMAPQKNKKMPIAAKPSGLPPPVVRSPQFIP